MRLKLFSGGYLLHAWIRNGQHTPNAKRQLLDLFGWDLSNYRRISLICCLQMLTCRKVHVCEKGLQWMKKWRWRGRSGRGQGTFSRIYSRLQHLYENGWLSSNIRCWRWDCSSKDGKSLATALVRIAVELNYTYMYHVSYANLFLRNRISGAEAFRFIIIHNRG